MATALQQANERTKVSMQKITAIPMTTDISKTSKVTSRWKMMALAFCGMLFQLLVLEDHSILLR
jgi:hypothetical protein